MIYKQLFFIYGKGSETLWKLRNGGRIKCLPSYHHGSRAVLRSEYLISRANISSISCNLKVRYCLVRSGYQLLSQTIFLQLIFKLYFSIFLSFTTALPLYFFLQIWKGLCPESIRIIIFYCTPLSLCFCLSALLSLESYLPIPQVQKLLILHVKKNIFRISVQSVQDWMLWNLTIWCFLSSRVEVLTRSTSEVQQPGLHTWTQQAQLRLV